MPEPDSNIQKVVAEAAGPSSAISDLWSEDRAVREAAAEGLSSQDPNVIPVILQRIIEGGGFNFNRESGLVIRSFGEDSLPYLFEALESEDGLLAKAASSAFWGVNEASRDKAINGLIELLYDPNYTKISARALLWINPAATEANEALEEAFKSPDFRVASLKTLHRINESSWATEPCSFPFEDDPILRIRAAALLLCLNRSSGFEIMKKVVIPEILNEDPKIQEEVLKVFRGLGDPGDIETFSDGDWDNLERNALAELFGAEDLQHELDDDEIQAAKELFKLRDSMSPGHYLETPSHILVGLVAAEYKSGSKAAQKLVELLGWNNEGEILEAAERLEKEEREAAERERRVSSYFQVVDELINPDPWIAKVTEKRLIDAKDEAIPALIHTLKESDSYELKESVLRVLRLITCEESNEAVEAVISCARDKDSPPLFRVFAIQTLGLSQAKSPLTVPFLLEILDENSVEPSSDTNTEVDAALQALAIAKTRAQIQLPTDALGIISKFIHPSLNNRCLLALGLIESTAELDEETLKRIILLESSDMKATVPINKALNALGPKLLPTLGTMLRKGDMKERTAASNSLLFIRSLNPSDFVGPILDSDPEDREPLIRALGTFSGSTKESLIGIERLLKDNDPKTRIAGVNAIFNASFETTEFADLCFELRNDESSEVREKAAFAFGKSDGKFEEIVASHFDTSSDEERLFFSRALVSASRYMVSSKLLAEIGNRMLKDPNPEVRKNAAEAAASWNQLAEERVDSLLSVLFDNDSEVRKEASRSILAVDPKGEISGVKIAAKLEKSDERTELEAIKLLGEQKFRPALDILMTKANGQVGASQSAARAAVDAIYGSDYR